MKRLPKVIILALLAFMVYGMVVNQLVTTRGDTPATEAPLFNKGNTMNPLVNAASSLAGNLGSGVSAAAAPDAVGLVPALHPAQTTLNALTQPNPSNPGTTGAGGFAPAGTTGGGMNQGQYLQGIQQEYNSAIQGGSNAIAQNQANLGINQGLLDRYIGAQQNAAQSQSQNQINTYNTQKSGVQSQQQLSLAQLADSIRGQNQGLQAQLGAVGAGASSAAGMGQLALGKEQNTAAANINQQAGSNTANINAQIQQVQNTLKPYLDTLEAYKAQQMQTILQNYHSLQNQLVQQIGTAQGEEKARLAQFGQTLQDSAGAALTQLDQQVAGAAQNFAQQQQSVLANNPGDFRAPALQNAPSAIQAPQVSPFTIPNSQGNNTSAPTGGSLSSLLNRNLQPA